MGVAVLILGESGTGKSASLRNFKQGEVAVINAVGKPLPFKNDLKTVNTDKYEKIENLLTKMQAPSAVIDDAQYLMANEYMRRANETGYQKFVDIGKKYWHLIVEVISQGLPEDKIVYLMSHIERDQNGNEKVKTVGKMLDEKITVEGLFTIVLKTHVENGEYTFVTQNSGNDTVKSPVGMFEEREIPNDLKMVDDIIRNYYGLNKKEENK